MAILLDLIPRRFMAAQLRKPSGWFGRLFVAPALNHHNASMNQLALDALEISPTDRVLEVGFGGGDLMARVLPLVPQGHVRGADFSAEMVDLCRRRFSDACGSGRLELAVASAEALPFPSSSFTRACTVNTIYFWPRPAAALAELWRVLEPGGRLVIGFSPRATLAKLPVTRHGFALFEPEQVTELLHAAGFGTVAMREGYRREGAFLCAEATKLR